MVVSSGEIVGSAEDLLGGINDETGRDYEQPLSDR